LTPWADDALVWNMGGDRPTAIPLPFEVRLRPPSLSFFGHETLSEVPAPRRNRVSEAPLAGVCVLTRALDDPPAPRVSIERLAGARALTTLLDHAHCFNPYNAVRKRQMVLNYLTVLSCVPIFEVRFHPSLAFLPDLVDAIIGLTVD
jgi:hypothetical protein